MIFVAGALINLSDTVSEFIFCIQKLYFILNLFLTCNKRRVKWVISPTSVELLPRRETCVARSYGGSRGSPAREPLGHPSSERGKTCHSNERSPTSAYKPKKENSIICLISGLTLFTRCQHQICHAYIVFTRWHLYRVQCFI